jgi:peptidoglycan/LPS O-acetylase OafA/YrhL
MIKAFEGMRGIAALFVALYHLDIGTAYFPVIRHGYLFVDLFFVLSGFIMACAYEDKLSTGRSIRPFLIRRIGRLYPLFIFSTIAFVLAANTIVLAKRIAYDYGYASILNNPDALEYLVPTSSEILATLTMTHSLGLFDHLILNTPTWSISVEFYTYFLFALLCLIFSGRARLVAFLVLGVIGATISVWASIAIHDCLELTGCLSVTYDYGLARCAYAFSLGVLAVHMTRFVRSHLVGLQIAASLTLGIFFFMLDRLPAIAFLFPLIFTVLILLMHSDDGPLSRLFQKKPFQVLGERSYSIYLMHMPLVLFFENAAKRVTGIVPNIIVLVLFIVVLVIISGLTYKFIENPFRKAFNQIADKSWKKPSVAKSSV